MASPQDDQQTGEANETLIETLRPRYTGGEFDEEAFERCRN